MRDPEGVCIFRTLEFAPPPAQVETSPANPFFSFPEQLGFVCSRIPTSLMRFAILLLKRCVTVVFSIHCPPRYFPNYSVDVVVQWKKSWRTTTNQRQGRIVGSSSPSVNSQGRLLPKPEPAKLNTSLALVRCLAGSSSATSISLHYYNQSDSCQSCL